MLLFLFAIPTPPASNLKFWRIHQLPFHLSFDTIRNLPDSFFFSCTHRISHPCSAFRGPPRQAIATTCFLLPCWRFSEDSLPREQAWSSRTDSRQLHPARAFAVLSPTSVFGSVLALMMSTGTSRQRLIPFLPPVASQPLPACSHSLAGLSPYPPNCPFILQLGQSLWTWIERKKPQTKSTECIFILTNSNWNFAYSSIVASNSNRMSSVCDFTPTNNHIYLQISSLDFADILKYHVYSSLL